MFADFLRPRGRRASSPTPPRPDRRGGALVGWLLALLLAMPLIAPLAPLAQAGVETASETTRPPLVHVLNIEGGIGPALADYVTRGLEHAAAARAQLVVLEMDTPGGLDGAMRDIVKAILASPVPVAGFVFPGGARAASAGTYILYACHLAAMAPGTNLGAATPVAIGIGGAPEGEQPASPPDSADKRGDAKPQAARDKEAVLPASGALSSRSPGRPKNDLAPSGGGSGVFSDPGAQLIRKQVHDAAAYIRGLAELRGRNAGWAGRAVREAVSLSAGAALKEKVIDLVAADLADLLRQADGRKLTAAGIERALDTQNATVTRQEPDWRSRLLAVIGDPSLAYILLLLGAYGIFFELSSPGFGLPGVAGGISLLLALFALQMLPVNYAGLALIVLGLAFMLAEAFLPSFGILGLGGVTAFVIGSIMLIDTDLAGQGLPWSLILPAAAVSALLMIFVVGLALKARKRPVATGSEELIGGIGEVLADCDGDGWAHVHSETWRILCPRPLTRGTKVRVRAIDGLTLRVEPIEPTKEV